MLLSKKVEGEKVLRCDECGEEITMEDILEMHDAMLYDLHESIEESDEIQLGVIKALEKLGEASVETDELLHQAIRAVSKKLDLLAEQIGVEFELTKPVESKLVIKKKSKK